MEMEKYMRRCLDLARQGEYYVAPNPMVGAVLVSADGVILGEGHTSPYGGPHAEVNAFADYHKCSADYTQPSASDVNPHAPSALHPAGQYQTRSLTEEAGGRSLSPFTFHLSPLSSATLYVSLEPCSHFGKTPPCADLIIREGVGRVVVGCLDPNPLVAGQGISKLRKAGIEVITGVLENECRFLNRRFICLHEKHRPYVILKWAQTADGFLAPLPVHDGEEERLVISTPLTKQLVHKMRAENMAIMVGTNTVIKDNPRLLNTHWAGRNPVRVILDRHGRLSAVSNSSLSEASSLGAQRIIKPEASSLGAQRIIKPKASSLGAQRIIKPKASSLGAQRIIKPEASSFTKYNVFSDEAETIVYRDNTDWQFILADLAKRNIHSVLVEGGAQLLNSILLTGIYDELHVEVGTMEIGSGIAAPEVDLTKMTVTEIDGNRLYSSLHVL